MARSKIEWLARPGTIPETWNPVTGCTPISAGCRHCYAKEMSRRLKAMGQPKYANEFKVTTHREEMERPNRWKKPRTCFVCSMSDLFHEEVPRYFINWVIQKMRAEHKHTFVVLTKRPERMCEVLPPWPPNVWAGVTVEHPDCLDRLDHLRQVPAAVRFVSFEPLLGTAGVWSDRVVCLSKINWVIVGAETGPNKRPINERVAAYLRDRCANEDIPFFFKKNNDGSRLLGGRKYEEWPK